MLIWLDGNTNTKAKPQENFGRELMELFTRGVGFYTEDDVYAAARVFTGWNLQGDARPTTGSFGFVYNANAARDERQDVQLPDLRRRRPHDSRALGVGRDAGRHRSDRRAGRSSGDGAAARDASSTGSSSARRPTPPVQLHRPAGARCTCRTARASAPVVQYLFSSAEFQAPSAYFSRYSWPAEFVVRSIKETGWTGFSLGSTLSPLVSMGQQLFEPPDVAGWSLGQRVVFDRRDADADEFRVDARREPEVPPGDGRGGREAEPAGPAELHAVAADDRRM